MNLTIKQLFELIIPNKLSLQRYYFYNTPFDYLLCELDSSSLDNEEGDQLLMVYVDYPKIIHGYSVPIGGIDLSDPDLYKITDESGEIILWQKEPKSKGVHQWCLPENE